MFHPGETVIHKFTIPFNKNETNNVLVTYKQNESIILMKTIASEDITSIAVNSSSFTVELSQQESLLFDENKPFTMQLNVILGDGSRAASKEVSSKNGVQHYKEVMTVV